MKATLNFDLDNVDDRMAHLRCVKALDMALVIWKFIYNTRKEVEEQEADQNIVNLVFERFENLLSEYNVNINELIV